MHATQAPSSRRLGFLLRDIGVCCRPVPGDVLPCREPDVVKRSKVLDDPPERSEPTRPTDPTRMQRDSDVSTFALQAFLADHTVISSAPPGSTHSKALMQCWAKASSDPTWPCQNLKSFCGGQVGQGIVGRVLTQSSVYGIMTSPSSFWPPGMTVQ